MAFVGRNTVADGLARPGILVPADTRPGGNHSRDREIYDELVKSKFRGTEMELRSWLEDTPAAPYVPGRIAASTRARQLVERGVLVVVEKPEEVCVGELEREAQAADRRLDMMEPFPPGIGERDFERELCERLRQLGHGSCKLSPDKAAGVPDLLVIARGGRTLFRELKVSDGRLMKIQEEFQAKLRENGQDVGTWRPADWPDRVLNDVEG